MTSRLPSLRFVILLGFVASLILGACRPTEVVGQKAPRKKGMLPVQQCPPAIEGHGRKIKMLPGVYECDLVIIGDRHTLKGYGVDRTVIDGNLIIQGHRNTVVGVRVTKTLVIAGDGNRLAKNHYGEGVQDQGTKNRY